MNVLKLMTALSFCVLSLFGQNDIALLPKGLIINYAEMAQQEQTNPSDMPMILEIMPTENSKMFIDFKSLPLSEENIRLVMDSLGMHHQDIVIKQARLETGHYTSSLCRKGHNLFGLRHRRGYYRFEHWSESIKTYRDKIQARYRVGENYYAFLKRIRYATSPTYVQKVQRM